VLLSQEEARFSLLPTLRTPLGVKGHRPLVGTLDCPQYLYVFGALNVVNGRLATRLVERPRRTKKGTPSTRRHLQQAFARQLRDIARASPATQSLCRAGD
jgi:hypothetical protein